LIIITSFKEVSI